MKALKARYQGRSSGVCGAPGDGKARSPSARRMGQSAKDHARRILPARSPRCGRLWRDRGAIG